MSPRCDNLLPRMPAIAEEFLSLSYVLIVMGPLFALVITGITSDSTGSQAAVVMSIRRFMLFINTMGLSAAVAVFALIIGAGVGSILWLNPRLAAFMVPAFLIVLPLPSYLQAAGWSLLAYRIGISWHNSLAAWWTMVMWLMPLAALAIYMGLKAIDKELLEAASLAARGEKVWFGVVMPLLAPVMAAVGGFVFVLALLDYTIPSLCQVNVYALDIFADFSLYANPARALILSLPVLMVSAGVICLSTLSLRQVGTALIVRGYKEFFPLKWTAGYQAAGILFALIAVVQPILPLFSLGLEALSKPQFDILKGSAHSLLYSLGVSLAAAVVCIVLGYVVGRRLALHSRTLNWWWLAVLIPWAIPSPLIGIGWIEITDYFHFFRGSTLLLILGEVTRFVPLAVLLAWSFLKRIDYELLAAARIHTPNKYKAFFNVELPLVKTGLWGAAALILAFTIGELGAAVMLTPPGQETMTVRIYNYLHYGAKGAVAVLCLSMGLISLIASDFARRMIASGERG